MAAPDSPPFSRNRTSRRPCRPAVLSLRHDTASNVLSGSAVHRPQTAGRILERTRGGTRQCHQQPDRKSCPDSAHESAPFSRLEGRNGRAWLAGGLLLYSINSSLQPQICQQCPRARLASLSIYCRVCAAERNTPDGMGHTKWCVSLALHTPYRNRRITNWTAVANGARPVLRSGAIPRSRTCCRRD